MKIICVLFIVFVLALGLVRPANAILIEADLNTSGDGLLTQDTGTGLEWLDLTVTKNHSYNMILADVGGYLSSGFHIAVQSEINTFYTNAAIPNISVSADSFNAPNYIPAQSLQSLIGITQFGGADNSYGIFNDENAGSVPGLSKIETFHSISMSNVSLWTDFSGWTHDTATSLAGVQLVRSSGAPVPEPATVALLGIGLVGLAGATIRRRRKKIDDC